MQIGRIDVAVVVFIMSLLNYKAYDK